MVKEIVIAAYDRNYDWVKSLDSDIKLTVYRKGEGKMEENEILIKPNLGRDIHTFFTHLYTRYDSLSDVTFFSQDYPFDHVSNYIDIINGDYNIWNNLAHQYNEGCWFFCTQYGVLKCDSMGSPHHPNLNLSKMWGKLFKSTPCPSEFFFTPTGHFAITNKQATKIPKSYYKLIIDILENEPISPWEIERLEPYIFLK